jgi:anti-sigma B factor antagonist
VGLKISTRFVADVVILDMDGRITLLDGSVEFRDFIKGMLAEGKRKILLNLADVRYIDSSGIGELTVAHHTTRGQGGSLKLLNLTQKVHDLLQITKLFTVFDVFDDENKALESFTAPDLHCCCPLCGWPSGPPVVAGVWIVWPPQVCRNGRCEANFSVDCCKSQDQAQVKSIHIRTYKDEYFELLTGPPFAIRVVGRLDLFSSPALKKAWQALPVPRKVIVDLGGATEVDEAGREALVGLLANREKDAIAVVSLEGLGSEQMRNFPTKPPFYQSKAPALAALGDVSKSPPLLVRVLKEDANRTVQP